MTSEIPDTLHRQIQQFQPYTLGIMIGTALLLALVAALISDDRRRSIRRWFLLEGSRWSVTILLDVFVFAISFAFGVTPLVHVAERTFSTAIFGAITSGLLSLIPIVVAVNQLTISQLFSTPEKLRNKIRSVQNFRTDIEEKLPGASTVPTDPDAFLLDVNALIADRAATLRDAAAGDDDPKADALADYAEKILTETDELSETVESTNLPLIEILLPIMDDEHSQNINTSRSIRNEHPEAISHRTKTVLEELEDLFISMDIIRQYFKGLYIQEALANLSKLITYTGAGAFVLAILSVMVFSGAKPLPVAPLLIQLAISTAVAATFTPIAILVAYIARIGTIVKHTVAPGAFTPYKEGTIFRS